MMLRYLAVGLLLVAAASAASAQGVATFDGKYVGELALTKVIDGNCTQPPLGALYPLTIIGGTVQFPYTPRFNTVLTGTVGKNGIFTASYRLRRGSIQMTGRIQGNNLVADIASPSCNYRFQAKF